MMQLFRAVITVRFPSLNDSQRGLEKSIKLGIAGEASTQE